MVLLVPLLIGPFSSDENQFNFPLLGNTKKYIILSAAWVLKKHTFCTSFFVNLPKICLENKKFMAIIFTFLQCDIHIIGWLP